VYDPEMTSIAGRAATLRAEPFQEVELDVGTWFGDDPK
jgi:hypothetical protein